MTRPDNRPAPAPTRQQGRKPMQQPQLEQHPQLPPSAWFPALKERGGQPHPVPARTLLTLKRVLLTGMSGTGKSSVIRALAARGDKAVDTDDGWSESLPDGRQRWREDAIRALLATEDADVLFIAGCEENQAQFHPQFDHIILLSAPPVTLVERLARRSSNSYGKTPEELRRVLHDLKTVEPVLRRATDHEVRTTMPLTEVVSTVLRLVDP